MPANSVIILSEDSHEKCQEKLFLSAPDRAKHEKFMRSALDLIMDKAVFSGTSRATRVVEWSPPEIIKFAIDLKPRHKPVSHDELLRILSKITKYSVRTGHPYFVNQLFSSVDPYGLVGQWLTDALNPSVYTFEVAPVFTLMEEEVLAEMRRIVGFQDGDGVFCPGGSVANGYGISCARFYFNPNIKKKGLSAFPRMVLFTSELAHYSIEKMAAFEGIGSDNCITVATDSRGRMDIRNLEDKIVQSISDGATPFMVALTGGTTVFGAYDPITPVADICTKYKLWLHVDAAWGGGALMSTTHRHLLDGIERADSVTWNPHKLLSAPQQCSTFLTKHKRVLTECHSANATYLFQKDKFYDTSLDTGDKHIQCGRRADVLKFWFMWKAKGSEGFECHINTLFNNAAYFLEHIKHREGFQLVLEEPECTNICFWYIPPCLRDDKLKSNYNERLHKVAPKIKEKMIKEGTMMITYQPQKNLPNFFRIVFQNSGLDHKDLVYFANEIERLGADLVV